ncbi:hypothetical protein A8D91_29660 [Burkholderia cenocepacia]|nr:hypothetical protein [Burkholderia contaminans]ONJ12229.1 hypothetical protein A8D83_03925 [Burkholderia cenocepacia]ONJ27674.1 hypothetical protein A8D90_14270 [Burkholderia cenocepacia]ONP33085.1 hypothetical protein A8D86_28845 [Burkholderia cenocepacia]ONP35584.1 hypothetical protein A8D85_23575 [Burkholderia cenocepacia]
MWTTTVCGDDVLLLEGTFAGAGGALFVAPCDTVLPLLMLEGVVTLALPCAAWLALSVAAASCPD